MNEEELERQARLLGSAAPFTVDWEAYAAQLITRLSRAERRRRRRSWWMLLAGTAAGAAAAWLFALHVVDGRSDRPPDAAGVHAAVVPVQGIRGASVDPATLVHPEEPLLLVCRRKTRMSYAINAGQRDGESTLPFVQRTMGEDGRVGEIRFYGFTPAGVNSGGCIVLGSEGGCLSDGPSTGL